MILIHYYGDMNDTDYIRVTHAVVDLRERFNNLLLIPVESVTREPLPLVCVEGTIEIDNTDLLEIGNQFCDIAHVTIRFGLGAMIFHSKGQRFDKTDLCSVENKMRETAQNFAYPDPNTA